MADEGCDSIYFYHPSFPAAIVFVAFYFLPTLFLFYLVIFRYKAWYFLSVPFGGLLGIVGYAQRVNSVKHICDIGSFASSQSLIVIAPLFIAAGNYILIGRLILRVLPTQLHKILGISAANVTKIFVGADILSFLIQVSGSGIASSDNWDGKMGKLGINVLIAGLSTQLATIIFFIAIVGVFSKRAIWENEARDDVPNEWERVLAAVLISSILITIRSIYRLIEFVFGVGGYPFTHEWTFYVLEAVPMLPALAIFCLWFPPRILPKKKYGGDTEAGVVELKPSADNTKRT